MTGPEQRHGPFVIGYDPAVPEHMIRMRRTDDGRLIAAERAARIAAYGPPNTVAHSAGAVCRPAEFPQDGNDQ